MRNPRQWVSFALLTFTSICGNSDVFKNIYSKNIIKIPFKYKVVKVSKSVKNTLKNCYMFFS